MEYKALSNIQHDGKFYPHGSTIDVDDKSAERLLARGDIEGLGKGKGKSKDGDGGGSTVSLDEAYQVLLSDLKNNSITEADAYTGSGKPDCAMLSKYAGEEVSGKARDAWWTEYQKSQGGDGKQEN